MGEGWICLHRELLDKPIWLLSTPQQKCILVTLLLMVNRDEKEWEWKGRKYVCQPGQVITSLGQIANTAGIDVSIQNVRTALLRFEKYEFLTSESTNRNRLITICNWDSYQGFKNIDNKATNKQLTSSQQAANKQLTTNNNNNNNNNNNINTDVFISVREVEPLPHAENVDYTKLANWFNETTKGVFGYLRLPFSARRKEMIRSRIREYGKETFHETIGKACKSDFLKGSGGRDWKASFDWMIKPTNFEKILSGNFDNRNNKNDKSGLTEDLARNIAEGAARAKFEKEQSDRKQ